MHEFQDLVRQFHEKFGVIVNKSATIPSKKDSALRVNLIMEESGELLEAATSDIGQYYPPTKIMDSTVGVADACADLLYVTYGAALTYGIDIYPSDDGIKGFGFGTYAYVFKFPEGHISSLTRKCMEASRWFAEASIGQDLQEVKLSLENLLNLSYAVAAAAGIDIGPVFEEVQRSNMSKVWADGSVRRRETDGKIMKPPTYSPADIKGVLLAQGRTV